jgi:Neutral/alkaline non-lysosomal ceramidase, N-terminal
MKRSVLALSLVLCAGSAPGWSQRAGEAELRAGAARVEYTPAADKLPRNYLGVLDPVYVRCMVIDNGRSRAALVSIDAGGVSTDLYNRVSARAAKELDIPAGQLLLSATHTHSAPGQPAATMEEKVMQGLAAAVSKLQPARVAWGTGVSYINVNRDIVDPATNRWWEGPNYEGTSDKTVAVMRVETLQGEPIAVYSNYAVHAVLTGTLDLVSGDIPGATSRYVERHLGGDAVALWTSGAAGDQNPIYFDQTYELRDIRIKDYAKRGEDISNAMPPGGTGLDRDNPRVQVLMEEQKQMTLTMGQMLGEEILRVMRSSLEKSPVDLTVHGAQTSFSCPARRRTDSGRAGYEGSYVDAGEVPIMLSALRIGDIYLAAVNAEVYNGIAQRLKRESPFKHTLMVTLTNGSARTGYIPSEDAYGRNVFTVLSSSLKPGCAEAGIVNGLVGLMRGL